MMFTNAAVQRGGLLLEYYWPKTVVRCPGVMMQDGFLRAARLVTATVTSN